MRCPTCGHDNSVVATRCASCGSDLPTSISQDDTIEQEPVPEATAERPYVEAETPQPTVTVRPLARRIGRARVRVPNFLASHQRGIAIGVALAVVGVLAAAWVVLYLVDKPSYEQVESDLAAIMPTYEYDGGAYGPDLSIPLSNITVTKRAARRDAGDSGTMPGMTYDVEAEATFDDGHVRVVSNVAVAYYRSEGAWTLAEDVREQGASFSARAGVDEQKVLNNMSQILASASSSGSLLADVYAGGTFEVVSNTFVESPDKDTSLDDVTIACRRTGAFYAYEGTVAARFAFESGTWVLRSAEASADATTRTYDPLVGTWQGTFASTESTGAGNCYGASGHELALSISSVGSQDTGHGRVQGTLSAVAHYHAGAAKSQPSDEGDTYLEEVPFTGTIEAAKGSGGGLSVECSTAGSAEGSVSFTLSFGTDDDPSAAEMRLTSSYDYEDVLLMLIPFQHTDTYTDTYILTKA